MMQKLNELTSNGLLPHIGSKVSFGNIKDAFRIMNERKAIGKVVVEIRPGKSKPASNM